ncbi:MAG: AraC family transcriptional regulator [Terriglobia bacterium]|nr:MAG: AraC family transcriptional regulator [Terriglobia bacterium]
MSRTRQPRIPVSSPDGSVVVRTNPVTFPTGHMSSVHTHEWDQLTYASRGTITVETADGFWALPPHRAVWVPAGLSHKEEMSAPSTVRTLYFVRGLVKSMPRNCLAVNVGPLLRELILYTCKIGALDRAVGRHARLIGVILDQIELLSMIPVQLPAPRDPRAARVAELLRRDPCSQETLARLARRAGAAQRTIERLFRAETKMSFSAWRARLRLLEALKRLAAGEPVTRVSLEVGYNSPSAFIARFKRELGATPRRFQLS